MRLRDLAVKVGVTTHRCDKEWGGTWGYKTPDAPRCRFNGYRSEAEAYVAWAMDTFGPRTAVALEEALKERA